MGCSCMRYNRGRRRRSFRGRFRSFRGRRGPLRVGHRM